MQCIWHRGHTAKLKIRNDLRFSCDFDDHVSQWHHEIYMPMDGIETAFPCSLLCLGIWGWYSYDCDDDHV